MSSYGNITTRIIDSVFDRANLRVEFRLPADNLYLSNMRLVVHLAKKYQGMGLSLEDLIAVKLELSTNLLNHRLYGFDIWRNSVYIVKDSLLKFAISTTKSKKDAARFLGLTYSDFRLACKKFKIDI